MDNSSTVTHQVPQTILKKLRSVQRAERRVEVFTGIMKIVGLVTVLVAMAMAIDALFGLFAPAARWGLTTTALALAVLALVVWGIRPLLKPFRGWRSAGPR